MYPRHSVSERIISATLYPHHALSNEIMKVCSQYRKIQERTQIERSKIIVGCFYSPVFAHGRRNAWALPLLLLVTVP